MAGLLLSAELISGATLPGGFVEEQVGGSWNEVVGLTWAPDGRIFVWERGGKVWIVEDGVKSASPFLDISEEVGGWRDFGLLGFCFHPGFQTNGYVYLLYVVDHHHLKYFGTPNYDPNADEYFMATIGRVTRYTARASDSFRSVDPVSRKVLLGESITNGFPILHQSHGVGTILFGTDGSLLVSCGDGASYSSTDIGSATETYYAQALAEGIIRTNENVGAYRSQMVDSLSGKILRLDPDTGNGIPGNPFYDPAFPRAARSRVWALGLRNPCRLALRPGTGSRNPTDANPGVLYIGNVGWRTWEDLHVCTKPGQNFGWPGFEGINVQSAYYNSNVQNKDAPNPLYPQTGCLPFFYFRDLIKQATTNAAGQPPFNNPCDPSVKIPASIPQFLHAPSALDWKHGNPPQARTWVYGADGIATAISIGTAGSPVSGSMFAGNCSIGGAWYTHTAFPPEYRNTYFHADYGTTWIKSFIFDVNDRPVRVQDFAGNAGGVVFVAVEPQTGHLYYIAWTSTVRRIRYLPGANTPPAAVAAADKTYGPAPLTVQFSGTGSTDPEGQALAYHWDFGDGSPASAAASPSHTFSAPAGVPTSYRVTLTVTDSGGATATDSLLISVNNTPPQVLITSPVDGSRYSMTNDTTYPCTALVSDAEHNSSQLTCAWQTILHHNDHEHEDPVDTNCTTTTVISPVGCDGDTYYYRVVLTVTDAAGLSTTNEARLYPDCPKQVPLITWPTPAPIAVGTPLSSAQLNATADVPGAFAYSPPAGTLLPVGSGQILATTFAPADATNYTTATASVLIDVLPPPPPVTTVNVNFQPSAAPVPPGYLKDDGAVFGPRPGGLTFGWDTDNTANTVDRNSSRSPDQRYDTFAYSQTVNGGRVWEIAVPNGLYQVLLVAGDPTRFDSAFSLEVEGVPTVNGTPSAANHWISGSNTVTVTDGRLTVSNGAGASNNKLCFVDIAAVPLKLAWAEGDSAGHITLHLDGPTGFSCRIEASQDLIHWAAVTTVTNTSGTLTFVDPEVPGLAWRFYRVVASP